MFSVVKVLGYLASQKAMVPLLVPWARPFTPSAPVVWYHGWTCALSFSLYSNAYVTIKSWLMEYFYDDCPSGRFFHLQCLVTSLIKALLVQLLSLAGPSAVESLWFWMSSIPQWMESTENIPSFGNGFIALLRFRSWQNLIVGVSGEFLELLGWFLVWHVLWILRPYTHMQVCVLLNHVQSGEVGIIWTSSFRDISKIDKAHRIHLSEVWSPMGLIQF